MTLLYKKITVAKSKEVKTGWSNSRQNRQVWRNFYGRLQLKKGCFDDDDDNMVLYTKRQKSS
jgi:hypothetical protein